MHSIGILGGSTKSAVHRAPLEIWSIILVYAISYPIAPSPEDHLRNILEYFRHDCQTFYRTHYTRAQLRRVCKIWNEILEPLLGRLDHLGMTTPSGIPPSCSRVELIGPQRDWNWRRPSTSCPCLISYGSQTTPKKEENSASVQYPSVIALVDHRDSTELVEEILKLFPNLRLFSRRSYMYSANPLPGVLHNITYLQVPAKLSYRDTEENACMPNLQTLSILYTDDRGCYPDTHPSSVGCHLFGSVWSFPNLINLEVTGEISSSWRMPFEEINLLFQNLGSTLEHLSYTVIRGRNDAPEWLSRGFWTHCVRIKTVYGYYAHLMERVPSQGSYGSIRVTLRDFGKPSRYWSDTKVHVYRKAIVWGVGHSLSASFGSFHMDIDWLALYKQLKAQKDAVYLAMISWLFGKFKQARQDLKDKYGDGLESIEGRRLTDWLDSVIPDPSKHLNAVFYRKREGPSHAEDYL